MRLLVGKKELLADVLKLQGLLNQYCGFVEGIEPGNEWTGGAQQLLRNHVQFLEQARISLQTLELASALVRHVLGLRPGDTMAIPSRARRGNGAAPEAADGESPWPKAEDFRHLIAQINALSRHAPIAIQERLRFLLHGLMRFVDMLPQSSPERLEEVLTEINLLTSNRESRHLVREVARLARDVYNSVQAVSDGLPLETLEETSEGASEAVRKLRSVIQRLERAASQNLDQLEKVTALQSEDAHTLGASLEAARRIQSDLAKMKAAHPETAAAVDGILERMGNEVGGTIMRLSIGFEQQNDKIMQQMSNQSFQDLSGATLKKIIAFVESVQLELLAVLDRYRSVLNLVQTDMGIVPVEQPAPAKPQAEASQDQVDSLLAKFGF
jgi:chemotaxis regulatin CheY-phosphate phosphatase CheZ